MLLHLQMDAAEREWLVTSAAADYHPMAKILLQNPHLAKRKVKMPSYIQSGQKHSSCAHRK